MLKKISPHILIWFIPILLGLPFIGRAYFVDDHYHMLMAKGLLEHPLLPYDFRADDAGVDNLAWEKGKPPRMVNPPLHHFILALFYKMGGERLWFVRLGCLLLAGFSALLLYRLAQHLLFPPVPVTLLCVLTPAFTLSSYPLMIDSTLFLFFLGGLVFWIEGLKKKNKSQLLLSGVFMGLAILTKYTGGFVVLLAVIYWGLSFKEQKIKQKLSSFFPLLFLIIPFVMLGGWFLWNILTYGAPHLLEASKRVVQSFDITHLITFFSFLGGGLLVPLVSWKWLWEKGRTSFLLGCLLAGIFFIFLISPWGGFLWGQAALLVFVSFGGGLFFYFIFQKAQSITVWSDWFLVAWLLIGGFQMIYIMQWVAVRYYLTIVPPVVLLMYRFYQINYRQSPSSLNHAAVGLGSLMFIFSLSLSVMDYQQASTNKKIVQDVQRDSVSYKGRRFFLGDSFTGNYLKKAGWETAFPQTRFRTGDIVLYRHITMPPWWFRPKKGTFGFLNVYEYPHKFPLRVMDNPGAAGFYASAWGALPFTFSKSPLERFYLVKIR